jgi:hypothetical protein
MSESGGLILVDEPEHPRYDVVRMFLEHGHAPRERMWGELVAPDRVRLANVSRFCTASVGDVFEVEPFCGCDYAPEMPHYRATRQVSQGSRRFQMFTRGTTAKRVERVLDYLETWPTVDNAIYSRPGHGMLTPGACPCCGSPQGMIAHGMKDPLEANPKDIHWTLALPLDVDTDELREFLDRVPFLAFHELMPEDGE